MKRSQKILNYALRFLPEALLMVSLVLGCSILTFTVVVQWRQLPELSEYLPEQDTKAFYVLSREAKAKTGLNVEGTEQFMGSERSAISWLGQHEGQIWLEQGMVRVYQINSKNKANKFLTALLPEGEEWQEEYGLKCYPSTHPECFFFAGRFLFVSTQKQALMSLASVKDGKSAPLKGASGYQNIRSRLPYFHNAFLYVNFSRSRLALAQWAGERGVYEPGYLESLLQIFPAYGLSLNIKGTEWYGESMLAVDKNSLGGEAFFRHKNKQEQDLLNELPKAYVLEMSGHDLNAQWKRTQEIMDGLNKSAALVFKSHLEKSGLGPHLHLLTGDYTLAWSPGEDFMALLPLEEEQQIKNLQNVLGFKADRTGTHSKVEYTVFKNQNNKEAFVANVVGILAISGREDNLKAFIDHRLSKKEEDSEESFPLAKGADEWTSLRVNLLSPENYLKQIFPKLDKVDMSNKYFDDGIFSRYLIYTQ